MALRHGRPEKMSTGRRAVEGRQKNKFFFPQMQKNMRWKNGWNVSNG